MALVAIVGPTASGKTAVSIAVAKSLDATIISADSRSIYRGMDIGPAKPTLEERAGVEHWGFDLIDPGQRFSVADFKLGAEDIIEARQGSGRHTVMVGGTGLYVDSVVLDYTFPADRGIFTRQQVEAMSLKELLHSYDKHNIIRPVDQLNRRRLQAGLLRDSSMSSRRSSPVDYALVVGIITDREVLRGRIAARIEQMFDQGIVDEFITITRSTGIDGHLLPGNIYPVVALMLDGVISVSEAKERMFKADWSLARRQMTWLRRNKFIHWVSASEAHDFAIERVADL